MSAVKLDRISKNFGAFAAVKELSLDLPSGGFLTLLGPSGCGKTTTLRILAGLEAADAGRVFIGGSDVTDVPTFRRNIGMVFQSLALFPHMTVAENVAFGLEMRERAPRQARLTKVMDALSLVHLEKFAQRFPHQLSGGQQQRVALARALVYNPSILLLDEPFAALDRKLREAMQEELRQLTKKIGITTIFVTHDQQEALVMSDLVSVMNAGVMEQCSTPQEIYERPATRFVADFMGVRNIFDSRVLEVRGDEARVEFLGQACWVVTTSQLRAGDDLAVAMRPQQLSLSVGKPTNAQHAVPAVVEATSYHGGSTTYDVRAADSLVHVKSEDNSTAERAIQLEVGQLAFLSWKANSLRLVRR